MKEHSFYNELEAPPGRSIWNALVKVADDARLRSLLVVANKTITTISKLTPKGVTSPDVSTDWSDFSAIIEAERLRRERRAINWQPQCEQPLGLLLPFLADEMTTREDRKRVDSVGKKSPELLKSA